MRNSNVIDKIHDDLTELSDLNLQRNSWLGLDANYVSSYVELMCRLFDDNNFNGFINHEAVKEGFSENFVKQLQELRDLLTVYTEKDTDEEIIADPKWQSISQKAQAVIYLWKVERKLP